MYMTFSVLDYQGSTNFVEAFKAVAFSCPGHWNCCLHKFSQKKLRGLKKTDFICRTTLPFRTVKWWDNEQWRVNTWLRPSVVFYEPIYLESFWSLLGHFSLPNFVFPFAKHTTLSPKTRCFHERSSSRSLFLALSVAFNWEIRALSFALFSLNLIGSWWIKIVFDFFNFGFFLNSSLFHWTSLRHRLRMLGFLAEPPIGFLVEGLRKQ